MRSSGSGSNAPRRRRVSRHPKRTTSTGSRKPSPSRSTFFAVSATTTKRRAAEITIFSRRRAPPPPLISPSNPSTSSAPSKAKSSSKEPSSSITSMPAVSARSRVSSEATTARVPRGRRSTTAQTARPEPRPMVMPASTSSAAAEAAASRGSTGTAASQAGRRDLLSLYSLIMSKQIETMLLIPVDDSVVFPTMTVTLAIDVGTEERVVLVPRKGDEFASVGTVAEVAERVRLPGGARAVALEGLYRGRIGAASTGPDGNLRVEVEPHPDDQPVDGKTRELEREYRAVVEELLELRGDDGRIAAFVRSILEPGALADTAGYSPDLSYDQKVELLETLDVTARLARALELQRERLTEMQVRAQIRDDVRTGAERQQREYFLRKQMESIQKELGEDDGSIVEEYREKIAEAGMPDEVREQAERELGRFERMGEQSGESSMIRSYLDWLIAVPWSERSEERLDPVHAREVLDADHAGLEDVKDRIVEYIAVRKLRQERGIADTDKRSGAILTLIGPPGTGKTSIGESIARATGREFVRMSLGGVRDEAEIRGHRRTYIGALPGRLVRALRDAGTMNPVILLDEVDKVGADWRGDPSSALLEVLDPAQNHSFRDHYLD